MDMKKNETVKALSKVMNRNGKEDAAVNAEYELAFWTQGGKGASDRKLRRHNYTQEQLKEYFDRRGDKCGATKAVHLYNKMRVTIGAGENGDDLIEAVDRSEWERFQYIVVKRIRTNAAVQLGNQIHDEAEVWNRYAETEYADFLCPVLRCMETRSDHNNPATDKALDNIVEIMQRAEYVNDMYSTCLWAEQANEDFGWRGTDAKTRRTELKSFAKLNGWWDVEHNPGNCGVIFDYAQNCYKAVFIDYAL